MEAINTAGLRFMIDAPVVHPAPLAALTAEAWVRPAGLDQVNGAYPLAVTLAAWPSVAVGVRATAQGTARWTLFVGDINTATPVSAAETAFDGTGHGPGHGFNTGVELPMSERWVRVSIGVDSGVVEVFLDADLKIRVPTGIATSGMNVTGVMFCSTYGTGFTATCDFAGGRFWSHRLTQAEVSWSANTPQLADYDSAPAEWTVDQPEPWINRCGPAATQPVSILPNGNIGPLVTTADSLGPIPQIFDTTPPGQSTQPPPSTDEPDVPDGDQDRLFISHTLPDNVVHTGRRVVELAVLPADHAPAPAPGPPHTSRGVAPRSTTPGSGQPLAAPLGSPPLNDLRMRSITTSDDYQPPARTTQTEQDLEAAIRTGQSIGYLAPTSFPLMAGSIDAVSMEGVKQALKGVDAHLLAAAMASSGSQLIVYPTAEGTYLWRLVPKRTATAPRPRLLFIETYTLTSFLGRYGAGRTLKTLTLLPGEKVRMQVRSYHRMSHTSARASSVLDSSSHEAESEFERLAMQEDSTTSDIASSFEYHADIEARGDATWGWGSASVDVSGGIKGNSAADRETFAKSTSNALEKHTSRASAAREVSVTTADEVAEESWEEADNERVLENINLSRTLNYVFRQMNQEYVTVLHLTDVKVAYFDGLRESRDEVPLHQAEILIDRHAAKLDPVSARAELRREIETLRAMSASAGDLIATRTIQAPETDDPAHVHYRVDTNYTSTVTVDDQPTPFTVPGVVLSTSRTVMRTDGVLVDAFTGQGNALDSYSTTLQEQEARRVTLENDQAEAMTALLTRAAAAGADELTGYAQVIEAAAMLRHGMAPLVAPSPLAVPPLSLDGKPSPVSP
ncbi:hypothetical protein FE697_017290 [Mumia zhuanghuii]|uniref:LamG domain-containing protein n=2 Tax=Mumia TaxID=1546255 RepID=A0ABW1QMW6_9ACTN|nr:MULTISPECIES: hypothetical protein [Mumia]KAA1420693.1 hypothetical protein FE697_017290 [Mumia zhuanghuii]